MTALGFRLGIDFGTSTTVAVLAWPDGTVRPLLFDGSPMLPSAVSHAGPAGLLVGRDAFHAARSEPARLEPNPKRRIDDGTVLLGTAEVATVDLIAAVLRRVGEEAHRVAEGRPEEVVLTHPAGWGRPRLAVLAAAAQRAGLGTPAFVAEPVAAMWHFLTVPGVRLPVGSCAVVYDFGAGTFDASVVRRTWDGCEVLATEGLMDAGGIDVDAAIVADLGSVYAARDPAAWRSLVAPETAIDRRNSRALWEDVRAGKEILSRVPLTTIHVPRFDDEAPLGREQLDRLAGPIVERTVAATHAVLAMAGVRAEEIFLVGGSSRMPLAGTLLHRAFGIAPRVMEQPELVVAQGSLRVPPAAMTRPPLEAPPDPGPGGPAGPVTVVAGPGLAGPAGPVVGPAWPGPDPVGPSPAGPSIVEPFVRPPAVPGAGPAGARRGRWGWIAAALAVLVAGGAVVAYIATRQDTKTEGLGGGSTTAVVTPSTNAATTTTGPPISPSAPPCAKGGLDMAGSSALNPVMEVWMADYTRRCEVDLSYTPTGIGAGIDLFNRNAAPVVGIDAPLEGTALQTARNHCGTAGLLQIPVAVRPVAVQYRLGIAQPLALGPETLAKIFSGWVTQWNAPEILADNPGVSLPSTAIRVIRRSDSSNTTKAFTGYLATHAGSVWTSGAVSTWPTGSRVGEAFQSSSGVANAVARTEGAIGYADWSTLPAGVKAAKVGSVELTVQSASAGAPAAGPTFADGVPASPTGVEPGSYALVTVHHAVVCAAPRNAMVKSFLGYAVSLEGQAELKDVGHAPLPERLRSAAASAIAPLG